MPLRLLNLSSRTRIYVQTVPGARAIDKEAEQCNRHQYESDQNSILHGSTNPSSTMMTTCNGKPLAVRSRSANQRSQSIQLPNHLTPKTRAHTSTRATLAGPWYYIAMRRNSLCSIHHSSANARRNELARGRRGIKKVILRLEPSPTSEHCRTTPRPIQCENRTKAHPHRSAIIIITTIP